MRVDSVSGEFVPYTSTVRCSKYGFPIHVIGTGTHVWPIYHIEPELPTGPKPVEAGLIDVTLPLTSEANAANTLLLYPARGKWRKEFEFTLAEALHICGRNDAALQVVAIFPRAH